VQKDVLGMLGGLRQDPLPQGLPSGFSSSWTPLEGKNRSHNGFGDHFTMWKGSLVPLSSTSPT